MTTLCLNCRNAVPEGAAFCPECGAPQLRVSETREPEPEPEGEPELRHTGGIAWPAAVGSAALYSLPAGLLLSFLAVPILDIAWVVLGSVWTLRGYRRRAPKAPVLTPELGGRIGLVLGLFAAVVSTGVDALRWLVTRYGFHRVPAIEGYLQTVIQAGIDRTRATNPDALKQFPELFRFWLSADGRGTLLLVSTAGSVAAMVFFAWLGGRFAVRYGGFRRRAR